MNGRQVELTLSTPGERLDKVLTDALPELSRTLIQQLIKEEQILVNGRAAKSSLKLEGGEQVLITLPEPVDTDLIPWEHPLDIRYEDDDLLVINKPGAWLFIRRPAMSRTPWSMQCWPTARYCLLSAAKHGQVSSIGWTKTHLA